MTEQVAITDFDELPTVTTANLVHDRAPRYAKQLISHWNGWAKRVDTSGSTTTLNIDDGADWVAAVQFEVQSDRVVITVAAPSLEHANRMAESISEHLHRFAGKRDVLQIKWEPQS